MNIVTETAQALMKKAVAMAPDSWIPGGAPDPLISHKHGLIGTQVSRLDGRDKVGGTAPFAAEFAMDGMVYGALAFSTVARGTITTLDVARAEAAAGVVLVMTHLNAPKLKTMPSFMTAQKACAGDDLPIMQDDQVHWNGMPIAIVLAETQEQADYAASLIRATYAETGVHHIVRRSQEGRAAPGRVHGRAVEGRSGRPRGGAGRSGVLGR